MGAEVGDRISSVPRFRILGNSGPVAQLLHPLWIPRNDVNLMSNIVKNIDDELSKLHNIKLVVSGGGFIEMTISESLSSKLCSTAEILDKLTQFTIEKLKPLLNALKNSVRDYIIGVDIFDLNKKAVGQFAVVFGNDTIKTIAWKSYPIVAESDYLAGFGTSKGKKSPRIVSTSLGNAMVLICHDAQAYNHRNISLVKRGQSTSPRSRVMREMHRLMNESRPEWVFNLIHQINKTVSINTFRTSYKQIHKDYKQNPSVVGSFGYGKKFHKPETLENLADLARFPEKKAGIKIILEAI